MDWHSGWVAIAAVRARVALPADLPPGIYRAGVLVDPDQRVVELDELDNAAASPTPLEVIAGPLEILTESLPPAGLGSSYLARIRVRGGREPATFALRAGALPPGLALSSTTGEIAGRPIAAGPAQLTVEVSSGIERASTPRSPLPHNP